MIHWGKAARIFAGISLIALVYVEEKYSVRGVIAWAGVVMALISLIFAAQALRRRFYRPKNFEEPFDRQTVLERHKRLFFWLELCIWIDFVGIIIGSPEGSIHKALLSLFLLVRSRYEKIAHTDPSFLLLFGFACLLFIIFRSRKEDKTEKEESEAGWERKPEAARNGIPDLENEEEISLNDENAEEYEDYEGYEESADESYDAFKEEADDESSSAESASPNPDISGLNSPEQGEKSAGEGENEALPPEKISFLARLCLHKRHIFLLWLIPLLIHCFLASWKDGDGFFFFFRYFGLSLFCFFGSWTVGFLILAALRAILSFFPKADRIVCATFAWLSLISLFWRILIDLNLIDKSKFSVIAGSSFPLGSLFAALMLYEMYYRKEKMEALTSRGKRRTAYFVLILSGLLILVYLFGLAGLIIWGIFAFLIFILIYIIESFFSM